MKVEQIKAERNYQNALKEIQKLWDAKPNTRRGIDWSGVGSVSSLKLLPSLAKLASRSAKLGGVQVC